MPWHPYDMARNMMKPAEMRKNSGIKTFICRLDKMRSDMLSELSLAALLHRSRFGFLALSP